MTISDDVIAVGSHIYIKATCTLTDADGNTETVSALAWEEETKKGMDGSQITGTASSYARKYCLNGLFLINDIKDADTDAYHYQTTQKRQAAADDDEDDGDDEEETEDPDRDPEAVETVYIENVNFKLQAGAKPKYTAEVSYGNAAIIYEGWTDNSGNANYSLKNVYQDREGKFTTFEQGQMYWYHLCIMTKGDDYFNGNTHFYLNGAEIIGKYDSEISVCVFDKIFSGQAQCYHDYKTYKTDATCMVDGREY